MLSFLVIKDNKFIIISGVKREEDDWIQVHADQEYVLRVDLDRINKVKVSPC